jgi:hypothetical protein
MKQMTNQSQSEFMFWPTHRRVCQKTAKRLNKICIDCGGTGFVGPVDIPGNYTHGWFTARNYGEPSNSSIARAVRETVARAGIDYD